MRKVKCQYARQWKPMQGQGGISIYVKHTLQVRVASSQLFTVIWLADRIIS